MLRKRRGLLIAALIVSLFGTGGPAWAAPAAGTQAGGAPRAGAQAGGGRAGGTPIAGMPTVGPAPGQAVTAAAGRTPARHTVTLITGDRVLLAGDAVALRPGKGWTGSAGPHWT